VESGAAVLKILVADRNPQTATAVERLFGPRAATTLAIVSIGDVEAAREAIARERPAVALVASSLLAVEDEDGEELARRMAAFAPVPVLVLAEPEHARLAGRILKAGADDWVPRDSPLFALLPRIVAYATERAQLRRGLLRAREDRAGLERLVDALLAESPLPIFTLDAEGHILRAGGAAARLFDLPAGRLEGRSFADLLGPASRAPVREELRCLAASDNAMDGTASLPVTVDFPDGRSETFTAVIRTADAAPVRFLMWLQPQQAHGSGEDERVGHLVREVLESGRDRLSLARVHLMGLERIREVLGARWPDLERRVYAIVERVLRQRLGPRECWCRVEGGFLVVFPDLDPAEVPDRLAELSEAVEAAVLGEEDLALRAREEGLVGGERAVSGLARLDARAGTVPVSREDAEREDLWEVLKSRFRAAAAPISEGELLLRRLQKEARAEHVVVLDRDGAPSSFVLLEFDARSARLAAQLLERARNRPEELVEFDLLVLARHLALLEELGFVDTVPLIEVHFQTLASRSASSRYLAHLAAVSADLAERLAFVVTGVDPGTYAPRLEQALASLRPHARLVGFQLEDVRGVPDLQVVRAALAVVDHRSLDVHPSRTSDALVQCIRRLRRIPGTEILLRGVPRGWSSVMRRRYDVDYTSTA